MPGKVISDNTVLLHTAVILIIITENGIYFAKMGSKIDLFSSINSDSFLLFHEVNPGLAKNIVKIDSLAKNIHTNQLIITV